jgi:hypothetical protein
MFNGIKVHTSEDNSTMFVPLPKSVQMPIPGGCDCNFCKAHRHLTPMWDTLALSTVPQGNRTWTVHYPELES